MAFLNVLALCFFSLLAFKIQAEVEDDLYKRAQNIAQEMQDNETSLNIKKQEAKYNKRYKLEKEQTLAVSKLKVLRCLGNRLDKHENGLYSYTQTMNLLTRILTLDNIDENSMQNMKALYQECKKLKIKRKDLISNKHEIEKKAFINLLHNGPQNEAEVNAFKLIKGYLINNEFICGQKTIYDSYFAFPFGAGAGWERRRCIDPFGRYYQLTIPHVSTGFGMSATLTRTIGRIMDRKHDLYKDVIKYSAPLSVKKSHIFETVTDCRYFAVLAGKTMEESSNWSENKNYFTVGLGLGFGCIAKQKLIIKTKSSPYFDKPAKVIRSINGYLEGLRPNS